MNGWLHELFDSLPDIDLRRRVRAWMCRHGLHDWSNHGQFDYCTRCPARRDNGPRGPHAWGW